MNIRTLIIIFILLPAACGQVDTGEGLAKKHCASCHGFPEPALLDKKTWANDVFPEMSLRMGLKLSKLPHTHEAELHEILQTIPSEPLISDKEWDAIRTYYLTMAPDSLSQGQDHKKSLLQQFSASTIRLPVAGSSRLTMVRSDPYTEKLYVATRDEKLFVLNNLFTPEDSFHLEGPASDIHFTQGARPMVLSMGIMDPNDQRRGTVVQLPDEASTPRLLIDSLKRPVDLTFVDLNQDGAQELMVSAFGNFTGGLFAYEKINAGYRRHIIHNFPGNRKSLIHDFNADGLPDILALVTQGNEHVALFTNRGNFRFSYRVLLKFPPVYGSSYLDLCDFNADGHPDILYTNGDNADYSSILKPYHGVRLFLNDGKNHFRETWFYPMHGASMAHGVDYDADGDVDIAAISFFPDFKNHPEEGFVYFENQSGTFQPFHTPLAASGRWITMESADIDTDGDIDIVLGALAFPTAVPEGLFAVWRKEAISLLYLKNNRY